jgi:Rhs element Vgr protein
MSVITATILSDGKTMDPTYELLAIDITREVNRIPYAQLTLIDGDAAQRDFKISNSAFFEPGKEIEIKLRYEGSPDSEKTVFKGLVIKHGIEADPQASLLTVELKDAAIKLTQVRKNQVFRNQTDDEIIKKIIQNNSLKAGTIAATQPKHLEIAQYYCTDWDFILSRADIYGLLVRVDDGEISLQKIALSGSPKHHFEYGLSEIENFEMEADASGQYADVQSIAWDIKAQKLTQAVKAKAFALSQGNLDANKLAETLNANTCTLAGATPMAPEELQGWADAKMARSRLAMLRGRLSVPGFADIKPLDIMEVAGVGDRFKGKTLVTGVRHRVNHQGWLTDVQFGLSAEWFSARQDISAAPAAGLLPAVNGLHIGIVRAFEEDPDKEFRVRVILPLIDAAQEAVWARLATPDAGKGRGYFFRPEVGDEVVVGFFNDDPRQAVILGALYSSKNTPPARVGPLDKDNFQRAIVTKKGTLIHFDDKKAAVSIETPKANKILLDDEAKRIEITDQHGNAITLSSAGIVIKSAKDVKIEASGNVEIKGVKVDIK